MSAKHRKIARRGTTIVVSTMAMALIAGTAFAYWTTAGTGSGTASAGKSEPLTVVVTAVSGVYPNQKTTVPVAVTNTNPFGVALSALTLTSVVPTGSGCAAGNITLDSTATGVTGGTWAITQALSGSAGSTPSATLQAPIAVGDLSNDCQGPGHSFALTFTVNGQSA